MSDITLALHGKTVDAVYHNKGVVAIHCEDGTEVQIGWTDEQGNPVMGEPFLHKVCRHVIARTAEMRVSHLNNIAVRKP